MRVQLVNFHFSSENQRNAEDTSEYEIHFHGGLGVGKTSIIDQFIRSEHDDVFNRDLTINIEDGEDSFTRQIVDQQDEVLQAPTVLRGKS